MYVDTAKTVLRGKTYYRHLLRDSYRENGKIKHHTIANLSRCSEEEIEAIKLALKYIGLKPFTEDQLHQNLLWLSEKQEHIERYLFSLPFGNNFSQLFLSDAGITIKDHLVLAMLSNFLGCEIGKYWHPMDISIDEGINELGSIRTVEITISNTTYLKIPTPTGLCKELLDAADVKLPLTIPIKKYS